ncbi:MAG: phytase, partial [Merismopediaceae bacterium]|nr:phytase [Merismopediaceae bacterium]
MATQLGTSNNDQLIANANDLVLGLEGNDDLEAGLGTGGNSLGGGDGDDTLSAGQDDLLLGDTGNDELEATDGGGNQLYGGEGDDQLYTGDNNQLWAGAGNDTVYLVGGNNQIWSGTGRDRLWIALAEASEDPNIIEDFDPNQDQMGVTLTGVTSLADLSFESVGLDVEIKLASNNQVLALVKNTQPTDFNENTVVFENNAPLNNLPAVNNPQEQARNTVQSVELLGLTSFATGTIFQETTVGGLSGITYDPTRNLYYAISDDRSQFNPARFYGLTINLNDGTLNEGDVTFTSVTTLRDAQGNPFATNSLDTEGIVLTENGSVYISSEGEVRPDLGRVTNPFVNQFSLSGQQLSELEIPEKFLAADGTTTGIRNNLAFESLTITPDRRYLYTATESALAQDGSIATLENSSLARILKYDLTTGAVVAEFVYEIEPIPQAPNPAGGFADNGLVELFALDNNGTLLALERSFAVGVGNTVKLYEVQTQGALNVQGFEDLYWEAGNSRFQIDPPVSKRLLVDFAELGITPDNLEGMTLGPVLADGRQSLIVVSDNNFNGTQTTQVIALGLEVQTIPAVLPVVETPETVDQEVGTPPLLGDSDDPAVWLDPTDAENSLVIGTLKDGGLAVFSLTGEILQTLKPADILGAGAEYGDLRYNNVDVLYNFSLGEEKVDIAIVSDRANDSINIFKIDPNTRQLVNITADSLSNPDFSIFGVDDGDLTAYGLAAYRSPITGQSYAFVTQAGSNQIAQLALQATASGTITANIVRTIELPIEDGQEAGDYQSEAIAVDQEKGTVYLAVEGEIGIVKFAAEPNGGDEITVV